MSTRRGVKGRGQGGVKGGSKGGSKQKRGGEEGGGKREEGVKGEKGRGDVKKVFESVLESLCGG